MGPVFGCAWQDVVRGPATARTAAFMVYMYSHLGRERDVLEWFQRGGMARPAESRDELGYLYGTSACCGLPERPPDPRTAAAARPDTSLAGFPWAPNTHQRCAASAWAMTSSKISR